MTRLLLALALLFGAASPVLAQNRGVTDPRAFVAATYARYQAHPDRPPPSQAFAYSLRLRQLFAGYDAWQLRHSDDVGSIDFDWWTNAQDYRIRNLAYRVINEGPALRWVVARFDNYDRHDEVRFRFVRQGARWYLDDAMQGTGSGDNGWTLSALLQNPAG